MSGQTHDYEHLFLNGTPMMDVRAPIEFAKGAFPSSENCPILDNEQRAEIGTRYRQEGKEQAIDLGHRLATPEIRAARVKTWATFVAAHPDCVLYCHRGGMRSELTQHWLQEAGVEVVRVEGGYRALRGYLMQQLESCAEAVPLWVISGRTGIGKTELLHQFPNHIDLEGLAGHRGSSFGRRVVEQPSQASFEHAVALVMLKHQRQESIPLMIEDESKLIGRRAVPVPLFDAMKTAPIVVLEASLESRVTRIARDYGHVATLEYQAAYGEEEGRRRFADTLQQSLKNIRKRLGLEAYQALAALLTEAIDALHEHRDDAGLREVIRRLLSDYYDPMYDFQLQRKADRVVFRGTKTEILSWWATRGQTGSTDS